MQPCQYGFKCPYLHISNEWDMMCTYPYIHILDETESFGFPDEGTCELMKFDSELYNILKAYEQSEKVQKTVDEELKIINEKEKEEVSKLIDELFEE